MSGKGSGNGNGGLSTSDRLSRIEGTLDRIVTQIETKTAQLDAKIETKTDRIEARLEAKAAQGVVDTLQSRFHQFEVTGSTSAQTALKEAQELETRVTALEAGAASKDAIESYRRWLWGLIAVGFLNLIWNLVQSAGILLRARAGMP
jgi:exonuclease VII small subunit